MCALFNENRWILLKLFTYSLIMMILKSTSSCTYYFMLMIQFIYLFIYFFVFCCFFLVVFFAESSQKLQAALKCTSTFYTVKHGSRTTHPKLKW